MTFESAFQEVAVLVLAAALIGVIAVQLRQPLVVALIAAGVLAGPSAFNVVTATEEIHLMAELGIALVLFVVGLKLDVRVVRAMGPVAAVTGLVQMSVTFIGGLGLAVVLGLDLITALYVALALTFSSTIIVVKLLTDSREIDDLHGRIAVGVLIVQDIVVILAIIVLTAIGADGGGGLLQSALLVVVKGAALLGGVGVVTRFALTGLLHRVAHSPELLVLAAIAWAVGLAALADGLGFSTEVGAFIAGVALATTPYREAIGARLVPLRDFLLLFFFLDLGANLDLGGLGAAQVGIALVLSAFVLVGKPLIVLTTTGWLGYRLRVGFRSGLSISQISEFSLIVAALGLGLGHIDANAVALITAIALITISVSTYAFRYADVIYNRVGPRLSRLERRPAREEPDTGARLAVDVIVFGLGRFGRRLIEGLHAAGYTTLAVDFDPHAIEAWRAEGNPAVYGDMEDPELPGALPLANAAWVVSTVPRRDTNIALLHALRHHGHPGRVAVTAHHADDARILRERGVDLVLLPFSAAAEETVDALAAGLADAAAARSGGESRTS